MPPSDRAPSEARVGSRVGKADRRGHDPKGEIVNEYPAWYHDVKIDEIENEVHDMQNKIDRDIVPANMLPEFKAQLEKKKESRCNSTFHYMLHSILEIHSPMACWVSK